MNTVLIIKKKRDGKKLSSDEINYMVKGAADGTIPDYQLSAWLMAMFLKGLNPEETNLLVHAMLHSGTVVDLSEIEGVKVDKHSTGGVGDKPSLVIAPVVAVSGGVVPMVSGRGLGHTGGTLDKLESIPGFRTDLTLKEYKKVLKKLNLSLIGQTEDIAPADKKLYALRDVTATVDSIQLISASIMSKKLAEGIDALVIDVKVGSGAFMKHIDEARRLANTLIDIGKRSDKKISAFITDMNQPLGRMIGNALEVKESIDILNGKGPADVTELCRELSAKMLLLADLVSSMEEGRKKYDSAIASGKALERFAELVDMQGGRAKAIYDPEKLPQAKHKVDLKASSSGYVNCIDTEKVGFATVLLGAGRRAHTDKVDPAVGIEWLAKLGAEVDAGGAIAVIHYNDEAKKNEAMHLLEKSVGIGERAEALPLIYETIS
ncbi:MAG: thymidine phosphorylase [Pseudomonadota bacterium]